MSEPVIGTRDQTPEDLRQLASAPWPAFAAGETVPGLSSWVLERKLGGGGFGEVWLARHVWNNKEKPRAVKFCLDPAARNRLVTHERNVVVRVMKYAGDHPNVVPLLDCNLDGDIPWLMYEFVEGGTLAGLIKEWRELPLPKRLGRAVRVLHALAGALATCHRFDPPLVHRDMKPQNVLMAGAVPRITDFGIGSVVMQPNDGDATSAQTAYAARVPTRLQGAGTRLYAPAEQTLGSTPSPRDDVYALGIIAYQLVTADLATGPGADATLELRDLKIPGELASLIIRSAALDPNRRPKDATEWETALAALIDRARNQPASEGRSAIGSKPVLLPEPEPAPAERTGPPLPPPAPTDLPPEPPSVARPVRYEPRRANPTSPRKFLAPALGGALILALTLAVALGIALLPPGKRSEPTGPSAVLDKSEGDASGGSSKDVPPEPKAKPPDAKADTAAPKAGETRDIEITDGVKMTFCWVPAGECQLGSPQAEQDYITKTFYDAIRPGYLDNENEEKRKKLKTNGFWMGKYAVTQAEWAAVMRDTDRATPSYFRVGGVGEPELGGVTDTSRFPVEQVSWDMICEKGGFLEKVNASGGIRKAFGKPGTFRLPHENEWEYACRGDLGNERPCYFGQVSNGTQSNINGSVPYGTQDKGPALNRPVPVGDYESKAPHPWGLCDMLGNVWQWCGNSYEQSSGYVLRGGCWNSDGHGSRAAHRNAREPFLVHNWLGVRLCFPMP